MSRRSSLLTETRIATALGVKHTPPDLWLSENFLENFFGLGTSTPTLIKTFTFDNIDATPLHYFLTIATLEELKIILDQFASGHLSIGLLEHYDKTGKNPIHCLMLSGKKENIDYFFDYIQTISTEKIKNSFLRALLKRDESGAHFIHYIFLSGNQEIIAWVLSPEFPKEFQYLIDEKDKTHNTLLHYLLLSGNKETVLFFLRAYPNAIQEILDKKTNLINKLLLNFILPKDMIEFSRFLNIKDDQVEHAILNMQQYSHSTEISNPLLSHIIIILNSFNPQQPKPSPLGQSKLSVLSSKAVSFFVGSKGTVFPTKPLEAIQRTLENSTDPDNIKNAMIALQLYFNDISLFNGLSISHQCVFATARSILFNLEPLKSLVEKSLVFDSLEHLLNYYCWEYKLYNKTIGTNKDDMTLDDARQFIMKHHKDDRYYDENGKGFSPSERNVTQHLVDLGYSNQLTEKSKKPPRPSGSLLS